MPTIKCPADHGEPGARRIQAHTKKNGLKSSQERGSNTAEERGAFEAETALFGTQFLNLQ